MKKLLIAGLMLSAMTAFADGKPSAGDKFEKGCQGDGTRTVNYTYDPATGALDATVTMAACKGPGGETHTGTSTLKGTFKLSGTAFATDLVETIDTAVVGRDSQTSYKRTCTVNRKGSYEAKTDLFTGTVTRTSCVLDGTMHEPLGVLESLLKNTTQSEE